jgi:type II restriction/modification system DNA methylase subunit YeeA
MNLAQIEINIQQLLQSYNPATFIFDLILAYGHPKSTITRLQKGGLNLSQLPDEVAWKKKLFFKIAVNEDVHELMSAILKNAKANKHSPRFIVVTDYVAFLAFDTKTRDTLDISLLDLAKHVDFFLPWAGMEKAQHQVENPADVKAAEKMAKLYDEIKKDNPTNTQEEVHSLNVFLSRLLFCFFAEDTGIFDQAQFTNSIQSHTQQDGSDLNTYLDKLFEVMNTDNVSRSNLPAYLDSFPYVNGGLLRNYHPAPSFSRRSRQSLIDSGGMEWKDINPDIFGSMIQAVVTPEHRGGLGMHYTSVPNIMKVIRPLFLDELYEEFDSAIGNKTKLKALLKRIWNIKIFDPACGSGNFLIIAYKELRRLEMKIFRELNEMAFSEIKLDNFYGIELDDFAHEIAILSLWLAEHQMNQEFFKEFGRTKPTLPLTETGNIIHGNATRLDWETVCPKIEGDEICILGNPPYKGFSQQEKSQKEDLFWILKSTTKLDYISCWFIKGARYIENFAAELSFVSTNSICQGEQVDLLWPLLLNNNLEISFAHQSFKWTNNAKSNAGVTCVIVGIRNYSNNSKYLYTGTHVERVNNINPYLTTSKILTVPKRNKPLSYLPSMVLGNMPNDFGHLHFTVEEKNPIIQEYPESINFFRKVIGSQEFIKGIERWCLWLNDNDAPTAYEILPISERLSLVKKERLKSIKKSYNKFASKPHRFIEIRHQNTNSLIIPGTSSENREYSPIGLLNNDVIINNLAFAIYDPELFVFSVLSSNMHNLWVRAVGGSLETRIRYSSVLCYNTFPFPIINLNLKQELEKQAYNIIEEREEHSEKTIAQLYDPKKMPEGLREAHRQNDLAVERCYRSRPFESDEVRLEYLFKLYEQMIAEEKERNGELNFDKPKSKKTKRKV